MHINIAKLYEGFYKAYGYFYVTYHICIMYVYVIYVYFAYIFYLYFAYKI